MEISQLDLFLLLLYSSAAGAALGGAYGVLRALRVMLKLLLIPHEVSSVSVFGKNISAPYVVQKNRRAAKAIFKIAEIILDILFMVTVAVSLVLVSYAFNAGRMRWMIFIGAAFGFCIFMMTAGKLFKTLSTVVLILAFNVLFNLCKILVKPVGFLKRKIKKYSLKIKTPKDKEVKKAKRRKKLS